MNTESDIEKEHPHLHIPTSVRLQQIMQEIKTERVSLGQINDALHERAFGFLFLILSLPCCIPGIPLLPSIFGIPMGLIAMQMIAGRERPWLPGFLARRDIAHKDLQKLLDKGIPWLQKFEKLSKPRAEFLTVGIMEKIVGVFVLILAISVCVPLPATNSVPSMGVALIALGFIERDGLMLILGKLIGLAGLGIIVVVYGLGVLVLNFLMQYLPF